MVGRRPQALKHPVQYFFGLRTSSVMTSAHKLRSATQRLTSLVVIMYINLRISPIVNVGDGNHHVAFGKLNTRTSVPDGPRSGVTRAQLEGRKEKAVRFTRDVLGNPDRRDAVPF